MIQLTFNGSGWNKDMWEDDIHSVMSLHALLRKSKKEPLDYIPYQDIFQQPKAFIAYTFQPVIIVGETELVDMIMQKELSIKGQRLLCAGSFCMQLPKLKYRQSKRAIAKFCDSPSNNI